MAGIFVTKNIPNMDGVTTHEGYNIMLQVDVRYLADRPEDKYQAPHLVRERASRDSPCLEI
jgi:hypothetical protein